jgi:hypothetical protein
MVWGYFSASGVDELQQIQGIINGSAYLLLVRGIGLPTAATLLRSGYIYHEYNYPEHTSKAVQNFFSISGVQLTRWPSQSTDLNPIEHIWDNLKRRLRAQPSRHTKADGLFAMLN